MNDQHDPYPPIEDYGLIGDCHTAALVSRHGSIDWCCLPRFDSGSCFGRLLGWEQGGYCKIAPSGEGWSAERAYLDDTMVLATSFETDAGLARLIDCFTMRPGGADQPHRQLLRVIECERGEVELLVEVVPRFDYGEVHPWLRRHGERLWSATAGDDAVVIGGDLPIVATAEHELGASVTIREGERARLSLSYRRPESIANEPPEPIPAEELDHRLDATITWWRSWSRGARRTAERDAAGAQRSAMVLKALTHAPTGAIAAAPTTSLPEAVGKGRNWDYRYSWIRDSAFSVRSLAELGYEAESDGFRRFVERSAAGSADELQIMFGLGGERRLQEFEIPELEGYRGSSPVRVGNGAAKQLQLDAYGELVNQTWRWHRRGNTLNDDHWKFLSSVIETAAERWSEPDAGLWELRGEPRHFVHSKAMCWAALARGIELAEETGRNAPVDRWARTRDEIRSAVEEQGYDAKRGTFVQAFGAPELDSALLLLPTFDFLDYDDERMVGTVKAVREELDDGTGLLWRYHLDDGLEGEEGTFLACSFWLVECLVGQGEVEEARKVFERVTATGNELGLFSEEFAPDADRMLGNFPQGLTHLAHIGAAVSLGDS
ncbi:MAG: glycoside hydrolase family 15 protein [Solirubrobacterales bacterium]|nr:glycoside hydrolase family 15 protein [Solirubrobacterales bacterium]